MKEIKVVCLCRSIWIDDLKLNLVFGDEVILSQEVASGSSCLNQAHRAKAVQLIPIERFRDRRDPISESSFHPTLYRSRTLALKPVPASAVALPSPVITKEETPEMDEDALAEKIRKLVVEDVARLLEQVGGISVGEARTPAMTLVDDYVPTFIPTGLVPKDAPVDLRATETIQSSDSLSAAVTALKKRRVRKSKEGGTQ